jgi:hypothetical protein
MPLNVFTVDFRQVNNDNLVLKFMFFNCKAIFRKYYFTIVLINNHKLVYRIKNHQKKSI